MNKKFKKALFLLVSLSFLGALLLGVIYLCISFAVLSLNPHD